MLFLISHDTEVKSKDFSDTKRSPNNGTPMIEMGSIYVIVKEMLFSAHLQNIHWGPLYNLWEIHVLHCPIISEYLKLQTNAISSNFKLGLYIDEVQ